MSDPVIIPDDHISAERARVAAMCQATMTLVGKLECELLAARAEANRLADELVREMAARGLAEQQLALAVAGQVYGVADVAWWIKALYAVAEAAKGWAAEEDWELDANGVLVLMSPLPLGDFGLRTAIARALLALGPAFDWREEEPSAELRKRKGDRGK
jgi:hypothetical protein